MSIASFLRKYYLFIILNTAVMQMAAFPQNHLPLNLHNKENKPFQKSDSPFQLNKQTGLTDFYPLNDSDYIEYVQHDTTVLRTVGGDYPGLSFSVVSEILGDTIMPNGMTYKKIRWAKCANSVNELPYFEYLRKDTSGNIYVFYNNADNLLYDFSKDSGQVYSSQYAGYMWIILNKYTVTGFGSRHNAIDFGLIDSAGVIKRKVSVIQDFGLAYYKGDINISPDLPEGSFFGAVINDSTFGYLLAKRQKIDWREFYPLHIGDFWKYKGSEDRGQFKTTRYVWAVKDTLMQDNNIYTMLYYESYGGPYPGKGYYLERVDNTTAAVLGWNSVDSSSNIKYKFSSCLGDTFTRFSSIAFYRYDDKSYAGIYYFLYPDLTYSGHSFTKGLGLSSETFDGGYESLVGAVIDGKVYGDTTVSGVEKNLNITPSEYKLFQNYPNPFNPTTIIKYSIPKRSYVSLNVYDLLGRKVQTLVDGEKLAGEYTVNFSAKNLASGVYIYALRSGGYSFSKKLILLK